MKALHEDLRWRVIYHQHLYGSSIKEAARYLFTSTAFVFTFPAVYQLQSDSKLLLLVHFSVWQ